MVISEAILTYACSFMEASKQLPAFQLTLSKAYVISRAGARFQPSAQEATTFTSALWETNKKIIIAHHGCLALTTEKHTYVIPQW